MDKKYKIILVRENCIGCSACAAINPKYWEMSSDGKSILINSKKQENSKKEEFELELDLDFEMNMDSAQCCPITCIHIYQENKKLI